MYSAQIVPACYLSAFSSDKYLVRSALMQSGQYLVRAQPTLIQLDEFS